MPVRSVEVSDDAVPVREPVSWRWDGETMEHIVLSVPKTKNIYILNPTAALVFYLCNGHNTVSDIAETVAKRFGADYRVVVRHVRDFVGRLVEMGVVSLHGEGDV